MESIGHTICLRIYSNAIYVYNEFYRIGLMVSRLMFIEVNMHVNLCNMHGNYLKTTHIKVVTNEKRVPNK